VPLCLLQAAVAGPLVRLLFGPRWAAAIPILQLLSIGMTGQVLSMPSQTLLKAQGRLRTLLVVSTVAAGCFLTAVTLAAGRGGLIVATATIAAYYLVAGLAQLGVSLRAVGGRWRDLDHVCTAAFAVGAASATLAWACGQLLPTGRLYDLLRLAAIPAIGLGLHALCLRVFAHDAWRDLRATIAAVAGQTVRPRRPHEGD
jgi:PST family polysaccharide transporter